MPLSLKSMLKKFKYKGQMTAEEYGEIIEKLKGHDKHLRNDVIDEFVREMEEWSNHIKYVRGSGSAFFTVEDIRSIAGKMKSDECRLDKC